MSRRSVAALVASAVVIGGAALLMDREDVGGAPPTALVEVEMPGDTIPVANVPSDAATFLEEGRAWRAARALRRHFQGAEPTPELQLLAARTEAEWGGWEHARNLLEGERWLDDVRSGEGWYWLGRALDEDGQNEEALRAYDRYLELNPDDAQWATVAELRRGLVLLRLGQREAGAEAIQEAHEVPANAAKWLSLLSAEALAEAGDTAATGEFAREAPDVAGIRYRARLADVQAHEVAGDTAGAIQAALAYRSGSSDYQSAALSLRAGRLALATGDRETGRAAFLSALDTEGSAGARGAAGELLEMGGLSRDQRLQVADVDARHGNQSRAAEGYRAWLADAPAGAARDEVSLRLGRALFNGGQYRAAESVLAPLHSVNDVAASALLLSGRSQYRRGAASEAFATFRELGRRFPGSSQGAEGMFLVGDLNHDELQMEQATSAYRQVATDFRGHDRAGLSLMRLGGYHYLEGHYGAAAEFWEEYRSTYPTGERWLQSTYWAGRAYAQQGDTARANERYRAVRERDPISYYSLLSAERLDEPFWPVALQPDPTTTAEQEEVVAGWMEAIDLLQDAGLYSEAAEEAQRLSEDVGSSEGIRYELAEQLTERGYAIRGIQIGQRLQRGSEYNARLLRILYPFPYRALIEAEAEEKGLDPFLVAALTRQESLFTPRISSPVGARGLMQIMPETGAAVARGIGIDEWDEDLLFNPEINAHLGTRYLAEQMDTYDESLPSVFSAYNAGPHRIDAWKSFPEFGDEELFTERIPYRETRDYVKILTRNRALYTGLYGADSAAARP